jgi:DNA-binding CsgD family transcriptional regulator
MSPNEDLTPRELQTLRMKANGLVSKQIAAEFGITENTVKNHMTVILRKLGAENTAHAVAIGFRRGLLEVPPKEEAGSPPASLEVC